MTVQGLSLFLYSLFLSDTAYYSLWGKEGVDVVKQLVSIVPTPFAARHESHVERHLFVSSIRILNI
ncbi:hypothetical protein SAMN04489735_10612 [Aneurinibacillus thermoaerophilus]|uniref:Uncharacterized protein n=1 Tax=Aneurinibacillus thermoaerophilus TaxID=143495 RepID=A0A1G8FB30_ANETH|nr:hypothetical protein SAMN04489735_10612 [Aneurinibacillus thermoaerophilus]